MIFNLKWFTVKCYLHDEWSVRTGERCVKLGILSPRTRSRAYTQWHSTTDRVCEPPLAPPRTPPTTFHHHHHPSLPYHPSQQRRQHRALFSVRYYDTSSIFHGPVDTGGFLSDAGIYGALVTRCDETPPLIFHQIPGQSCDIMWHSLSTCSVSTGLILSTSSFATWRVKS